MAPHGTAGDPVREVLAQSADVRVQLVTVEAGQAIPWHFHSDVTDTIVAVVGTVVVETQDPPRRRVLRPAQRLTLPPRTVHRVAGDDNTACRFINVHADGRYDFRAVRETRP